MKEVGTVGFDDNSGRKMNSLDLLMQLDPWENLQGQSSKSFKLELLPIRQVRSKVWFL